MLRSKNGDSLISWNAAEYRVSLDAKAFVREYVLGRLGIVDRWIVKSDEFSTENIGKLNY